MEEDAKQSLATPNEGNDTTKMSKRTIYMPFDHIVQMLSHYVYTLNLIGPTELLREIHVPIVIDEEQNVEIILGYVKNESTDVILN